MAGHSKWSNIKRRKGAQDAARGKLFTKIGREIQVAVKAGGPDPANNRALEDAITRAKSANMPNDTVARAIKRAAGGDAEDYEEILYEGYGPGGVAVMVRSLTDNRNRTAGEVRHLFDKYGGNLGENGCVSFMFARQGSIILDRSRFVDEETVMMEALEAGADDFQAYDEYFEVLTEPANYHTVLRNMQKMGYAFEESGLEYKPLSFARLDDPEQMANMDKLLDALEEDDDVNAVWHNLEDTDD